MSSFQPGTSATLKTHLLHSSVLRAIEEETAPNTVTKVVPGKKKDIFCYIVAAQCVRVYNITINGTVFISSLMCQLARIGLTVTIVHMKNLKPDI